MAKLNESNLNDIDESIEHKKINVDVYEDGKNS